MKKLRTIVTIAERYNKLAAYTETGYNKIPIENWWTEYLLGPIKSDSIARKLSWVLVWRNAGENQYFAPYPGQISAEDFIKFADNPFTLFEDELPSMYIIKE